MNDESKKQRAKIDIQVFIFKTKENIKWGGDRW